MAGAMSASVERSPVLTPDLVETGQKLGRFRVVIFNDDVTPYSDVVTILMQATGCDLEEAAIETWEAHHFGQADVHFADEARCQEAARTIRSIGVRTDVRKEWDD